ncbi:glutamate 5-kinase [Rhabdaerophilum sp. SD176]|uniref:glutamate 5-kinase n=1 Tax=Rhabdaerophilum sp. SD176 TaxID=2983548 RepID=UPI0024DFC9A8|nr:glutamate 5-kinase [Rhabdaerophilum sp. SD176]
MPSLSGFRRIVIKVGSSLLVERKGGLKKAWLEALTDDIAALHAGGADVLVVSSGAIAMGRTVLGLKKPALELEEAQAAAAVGQIALARVWAESLARHGITAAQILLTYGDTEERRRYLNARATLGTLLHHRAIPVINENDTVATTEIRYGDNDRLAARVGSMASADCVVLLSDIDGLFTAPPQKDPQAEFVPVVPRITARIEAMAGGAASELSRGGMMTKIEAAKIATAGGATMLIANGLRLNPLQSVIEGARCTWFLSPSSPVTARKRWIAGTLEPRGMLVIDDGAVKAIQAGKSLLPAGVHRVEGSFARGDCVVVRGPDGGEVARGLVAYDAVDAIRIAGRGTRDIEPVLGYAGRKEIIHRDDLVLSSDGAMGVNGDE